MDLKTYKKCQSKIFQFKSEFKKLLNFNKLGNFYFLVWKMQITAEKYDRKGVKRCQIMMRKQ